MIAAAAPPSAAPCRECGTTGGMVDRGRARPRRARGMCNRCYRRAIYASPSRRRRQVHQDCWAPRLDSMLPVLDARFGLDDLTPKALCDVIRRGMHPGPAPGLARLLTAEAIGRGRTA
jgi:hypothetical protein